jgi:exo-1,4-beta-D-glucosaminidase
MYSYKSKEVGIVNSYLQKFTGLQIKATVYNIDGSLKYTKSVSASIDADASKMFFALPAVTGLSPTYFVRLQLNDRRGNIQSINWYWLSQKAEVLNWKKSNWFTTPESAYADYSALQQIPKTSIKLGHVLEEVKNDSTTHRVTITNTGKSVAFFVHLRALKGKKGDDILPVIFSDNYISLAPGETRVIKCTYGNKDASDATPYFLTSAWNVDTAKSESDEQAGFEDGLPVN